MIIDISQFTNIQVRSKLFYFWKSNATTNYNQLELYYNSQMGHHLGISARSHIKSTKSFNERKIILLQADMAVAVAAAKTNKAYKRE